MDSLSTMPFAYATLAINEARRAKAIEGDLRKTSPAQGTWRRVAMSSESERGEGVTRGSCQHNPSLDAMINNPHMTIAAITDAIDANTIASRTSSQTSG